MVGYELAKIFIGNPRDAQTTGISKSRFKAHRRRLGKTIHCRNCPWRFSKQNRRGMASEYFSGRKLLLHYLGGEKMSAWTAYAIIGFLVVVVGFWAGLSKSH